MCCPCRVGTERLKIPRSNDTRQSGEVTASLAFTPAAPVACEAVSPHSKRQFFQAPPGVRPVLQSMRSSAKYIWIFLIVFFVGGFLLAETSGLLGVGQITPNTAVAE